MRSQSGMIKPWGYSAESRMYYSRRAWIYSDCDRRSVTLKPDCREIVPMAMRGGVGWRRAQQAETQQAETWGRFSGRSEP